MNHAEEEYEGKDIIATTIVQEKSAAQVRIRTWLGDDQECQTRKRVMTREWNGTTAEPLWHNSFMCAL